jgi:uncharacterized protein YndB with AHSA1/START domain
MAAAQPVLTVVREIKAPPETVFSFFTEAERWLSWMGVDAQLDPRPGGVFRMNVLGDGYASGHFVVVEPPSRISFTWGWEAEGSPVPPASSTVEITLEPTPTGTEVRLAHHGLPLEMFGVHQGGWEHFLERLAIRATGGDTGPDPLAVTPT